MDPFAGPHFVLMAPFDMIANFFRPNDFSTPPDKRTCTHMTGSAHFRIECVLRFGKVPDMMFRHWREVLHLLFGCQKSDKVQQALLYFYPSAALSTAQKRRWVKFSTSNK
jgi:hypothetical protein